jgi:TM2 domain-containing membrane protein YozV
VQQVQVSLPLKSTGTAYLWWFFLGALGAHKFYLGRPLMGIIYAFTIGLLFLGLLWDLFTLPSQVRRTNRKIMHEARRLYQN